MDRKAAMAEDAVQDNVKPDTSQIIAGSYNNSFLFSYHDTLQEPWHWQAVYSIMPSTKTKGSGNAGRRGARG